MSGRRAIRMAPWHTASGRAGEEAILDEHLFDHTKERHRDTRTHVGVPLHQHELVLRRPPGLR